MTIYFIRAGDDGFVKIGKSKCPDKRLASLQSANPLRLSIIRTIDGDSAEERIVHMAFEHLHVHGEWFRFSDEMLTADYEQMAIRKPAASAVSSDDEDDEDYESVTKTGLLSLIADFCQRNKITPTDFGVKAVGNRALVTRLKSPDSGITLATADRVLAFMREWRG